MCRQGSGCNLLGRDIWGRFVYREIVPQTLNDVLQILGVMLLQKTPINQVFSQEDVSEMVGVNRNQLELFDL